MKKTKAQKVFGQIAFEKFYSEIFGERWENLKSSLAKETLHAELSYKNCESYFLDPASIVAALCLPVKHSEKILDLCAAPGRYFLSFKTWRSLEHGASKRMLS